jgi:hypothetical protein
MMKLSVRAEFVRDNSYYHESTHFLAEHLLSKRRKLYGLLCRMIYNHCVKAKHARAIYYRALTTFGRFLKLAPKGSVEKEELWTYMIMSLKVSQLFFSDWSPDEEIFIALASCDKTLHVWYRREEFFLKSLRLDVNVPSWLDVIDTLPLSADDRENVENLILFVTSDYNLVSRYPVFEIAMGVVMCVQGKEPTVLTQEIWKSYLQVRDVIMSGDPNHRTHYPLRVYNELMATYYNNFKDKVADHVPAKYNIITKPPFRVQESIDKKTAIGSGTFSTVYSSEDPDTKTSIAIKAVDFTDMATFLVEVYILITMNHPGVVKVLEYGAAGTDLYLKMPRAVGDVQNFQCIKQPERIKVVLKQILEALEYLHERRIVHRDLKPANVLVYPEDKICLCDFGWGQELTPHLTQANDGGTLWYRSIDLLLENPKYDTSTDIWAVGCIFYKMVVGTSLFRGDCISDQIGEIFAFFGTPIQGFLTTLPLFKATFPYHTPIDMNKHTAFPKRAGPKGVALFKAMLAYNPNDRITAAAALKSQFFIAKTDPMRNE